MKLSDYLIRNNLSLGKLAKLCGTSPSTILRMKEAEVVPSRRVATALWQATGGQVTPNDLFGLHYANGKCACVMPVRTASVSIISDQSTVDVTQPKRIKN